ncbi:uncharacterized protein LOC143241683 [Tachypleus tridentatus]|uniref:uncharacterized protein LOC143241683 n=1 Tax=Tachypleus tridentatus TaxID=6853 RepID=UPI003FD6227A
MLPVILRTCMSQLKLNKVMIQQMMTLFPCSVSDNETVDCSQHDVMSLKCEPKEELQQINSQLEGLSDLNPYLNNYSGKQFPGHYIVKTKSLVSKSTNYRSLNQSGDNIFDETVLRVNNQKISNISHVESMSCSNNVCDRELGKIIVQN